MGRFQGFKINPFFLCTFLKSATRITEMHEIEPFLTISSRIGHNIWHLPFLPYRDVLLNEPLCIAGDGPASLLNEK